MRTDAGYRRQDGTRDDMTGHMAWRQTPRDRKDVPTATHCPYALPLATVKEGKEWDAQEVTHYRCYLYRNLGQSCRSDREQCIEAQMITLLPGSPAARHAATGLPTS